MTDIENVIRLNDKVILTELEEENEGVLLHLDTKMYYTLNETGIFLWKAIENNNSSKALIEKLYQTYEIGIDKAESTVKEFIAMLSKEKLIELSNK